MRLLELFEDFLSDFKWYRRKKGGKWYRVCDHEACGFGGGNIGFWTQRLEDGYAIEKIESY